MGPETTDFSPWIGRREVIEDELALSPALGAAAMLDDTMTLFEDSSALPPLWHWFYFLPRAPQAQLGIDGHPQRGGFMPPISFPRRMFAGARLRFYRPLRIGRAAQREVLIRDIRQKSGRSGSLAFVSLFCSYRQDGELCIEEEQDIVYREPGPPIARPPVVDWPSPPPQAWSRVVTPDPKLLFRFSALTFNAHRIHYDRSYATEEEGYPGLVVHGPLTALLLTELVRTHTRRPLRGFSFRGLAPLFDLAPFRLLCVPSDQQLALEAQGPDGLTAMQASADLLA